MKAKDFRSKLSKTVANARKESEIFEIKIFNVEQVAQYLSVSKGHIYNLVSRREIPFRKRGRLYFIPREIFDWIYEEA